MTGYSNTEQVVRLVVLDRPPVAGGPGADPVLVPDRGVEDRVRVNDIDADVAFAPLERAHASQLGERRLRRRVSGRTRARCRDVLRRVHDDPTTARCARQELDAGTEYREIGVDVHSHHVAPRFERERLDGARGWEHTSVQDEHVEPAEAGYTELQRMLDLGFVGYVALDTEQVGGCRRRYHGVAVEGNYCRVLRAECLHRRPSDTRSAAGDEGDLAGEQGRRAGPGELGLFELPVLDVEEITLWERLPLLECIRPFDGIERVQRYVGPDRGFPSGPSDRQQAELGVDYHPRGWVKHRKRLSTPDAMTVEVGAIVACVRLHVAPEHRDALRAYDVVWSHWSMTDELQRVGTGQEGPGARRRRGHHDHRRAGDGRNITT